MFSQSSAFGHTPRMAPIPSPDNLTVAAPDAFVSPHPRTGSHVDAGAVRSPSGGAVPPDAPVSIATLKDDTQPGPASRRRSSTASPRHQYPSPRSTHEQQRPQPPLQPPAAAAKLGGTPPPPLTEYYRHDNAAYDSGAGYDADGSCGDAVDEGSHPLCSCRKSSVSILLRRDPAAAQGVRGGWLAGPKAATPLAAVAAAAAAAERAGNAAAAVIATASWAVAPSPSAPPQLHAPSSRTRSARSAAVAVAAGAPSGQPLLAGTMPYAAARPLLRKCDSASSSTDDDDGDDANRRLDHPHTHTHPHTFAPPDVHPVAAAAACLSRTGGGRLPVPHLTDEDTTPVIPTPPLSVRSSLTASPAGSSADLSDRLPPPEPLGTPGQPTDADATAASASAAVTPSWGSTADLRSGDSSAAGESAASTTSSGGGGAVSRGPSVSTSGSRRPHGREMTWSPGSYGTCSSGGGGRGSSAGEAGAGGVASAGLFSDVAAAALLPSTPSPSAAAGCGPGGGSAGSLRRVQLSISFLPALSPTPLSEPAPAPAPATAFTSVSFPTAAAATPAGYAVHLYDAALPPQSLRVADGSPAGQTPASAQLSRSASTSSRGPEGAAAPATAATSAAEASAPGDGVVVVADAGGAADLEDIDVVASISVTAAGADEALQRAPGGPAVAAVAAGGDGDDGAVAGALPPELRRRLSGHMGRQRAKSIRSWKDLSHSMASQPPGYWLLSTMLLLLVMVGAFLFMAAQYEFVRPIDLSANLSLATGQTLATSLAGDPLSSYCWGPASLRGWLSFWRSPSSRTFTFDYLRLWGGRFGPDLAAGQWWRWVTSLLLHQSSMHLASNTALFLVLSAYLESLFGFWRVLPVWLVAGVAGNMVSAFFESPCMLVVGSSGAVFGLLGAYVADAALNFESIPLLWLRLAGMAAVAALLVALQVTGRSSGAGRGSSTSHASHIGGFLAGVMLAVLLTPDFKAKRSRKVTELLRAMGAGGHLPDPASPGGRQLYSFWQRHRVLLYTMYGIVVAVLLMMLVALPVTLYLRTFQRMVCG